MLCSYIFFSSTFSITLRTVNVYTKYCSFALCRSKNNLFPLPLLFALLSLQGVPKVPYSRKKPSPRYATFVFPRKKRGKRRSLSSSSSSSSSFPLYLLIKLGNTQRGEGEAVDCSHTKEEEKDELWEEVNDGGRKLWRGENGRGKALFNFNLLREDKFRMKGEFFWRGFFP